MALADGPQHLGDDSDPDSGQTIFSDINITPFTDVILVLLIIFMVSSSAMVDAAREGRLDVTLPQAGHVAEGEAPKDPLVVGVAADGRLFARGQFMDSTGLAELLREAHATSPDTVVIVDADGTLPHRKVVDVIDAVRAAGFAVVGIGAEAAP